MPHHGAWPGQYGDTVDIIFIFLRHIVVEHRIHIIHIDAAGRHVGCHKYTQLSVPETLHHLLPLHLRDIAVNALGLYPAYLQKLGCPLHHTFGVAEHHDPLIAFFVQNAEHGFHFGIPRHIDAVLDNVRLVLLVGPDGDLLASRW